MTRQICRSTLGGIPARGLPGGEAEHGSHIATYVLLVPKGTEVATDALLAVDVSGNVLLLPEVADVPALSPG